MDRLATTTGLYPLPDWAKTTLRSLKGKQRHDLIDGEEGEEIVGTYDEARAEAIDWQINAGLDRAVEGQLRWDDMICHPLAVHDAVETGGLRRYYDNNNFYRACTVTDELTADGDLTGELSAAADIVDGRPLQAVIPGPYSLGELADDEYYDDPGAFREALAAFLAREVTEIPDVATAFVLEPSLAVDPPEEVDPILEAIDVVAEAFSSDTDVILHNYWGVPNADTYAGLLESAADGIGLDLVTAADAAVQRIAEHGTPGSLSLGVVDGQNTRVESAAEIDDLIGRVQDAGAEADRLYLCPNTETFYLPIGPFQDKLNVLANAAAEVEA